MRFGPRPRRRHAAKPIEAPAIGIDARPGDRTSVTHPTVDAPGGQISLEASDVDAPVLVRVSPEALDVEADLSGEDPGVALDVPGDQVAQGSTAFAGGDPGRAGADAPSVDLQAEPEVDRPVEALPAEEPSLEIRLARIHLRTGSLAMARFKLETLAGREGLDMAALLDLAEARWRTGDLDGAGDAATAYLADGGTDPLGAAIAAEAAARTTRHADPGRHDPGATGAISVVEPGAGIGPESARSQDAPVAPKAVEKATAAEVPLTGPTAAWRTREAVEAGCEVAAGRSCLEADDSLLAAAHLGVAIRLAPELAGVVLEAIGERSDLPLRLVRGDALRLLGLEDDAREAYLSVVGALNARGSTPEAAQAVTTLTASAGLAAPAVSPAERPVEPAALHVGRTRAVTAGRHRGSPPPGRD